MKQLSTFLSTCSTRIHETPLSTSQMLTDMIRESLAYYHKEAKLVKKDHQPLTTKHTGFIKGWVKRWRFFKLESDRLHFAKLLDAAAFKAR